MNGTIGPPKVLQSLWPAKYIFLPNGKKQIKKPVSYRQEQEKECLGYGLAEPDESFNKE